MNVVLPRRWLVFPLLIPAILFLMITGCSDIASQEPIPPEIHYGEDTCEFCGMIISEARFAAGYITSDGEEHIFDDLGGMFQAHLQRQDSEKVTAFFVHDYEEERWIRAETAFYMLSQELSTPMLSGLVACATSDRATALASDYDGQVMTFDEVLTFYQSHTSMATEDREADHHHNLKEFSN